MKSEQMKQTQSSCRGKSAGVGIGIGVAIGAGVGTALKNLAFGVGIGAALVQFSVLTFYPRRLKVIERVAASYEGCQVRVR
jgi:hypothetical protein